MSGRRVLVTGAGGFIGRHVVEQLRADGSDPVVVEHRWDDIAEVSDLIARRPVTVAIHLGWYTDPADYLVNEFENRRCVEDTLDLQSALADHGVPHLIVTGSCAEYGPQPDPHLEDEVPRPAATYGLAKAALHAALRPRAADAGMRLTWARVFNLTGPGEHRKRVTSVAAAAMLRGELVDLSAGLQTRDYLDVLDVARALVALADSGAPGTFNVCRGSGATLRSLLHLEALAVDRRLGIHGSAELLRFGARPCGPGEPLAVVGSSRRLRTTTDWAPSIGPLDMADRLVGHHLSQLEHTHGAIA